MDCRFCRNRHTCDDYLYYDDWCCNKFTFDTSLSVDDVCGRRKMPVTNADHIRSMTDEELAEFLDDNNSQGCVCPARDCRPTCHLCITEWLTEPYKENTETRLEAYHILHTMWKDADEKQKEAIEIAQNDIEFVDLMPDEYKKPKRGQWLMQDTAYGCSLCGQSMFHPWANYCPNCGAKMNEERKN